MAITNKARLKEVKDAVDKLLHAVQSENEDLAQEIPRWLTGKYGSYQYVYEKMHQAVSATCDALGHKDLAAIIPAQVTEITPEEYWAETKVLANFIEANFAETNPTPEPKAVVENRLPVQPQRDFNLVKRFFIARNWFALRGRREALANILPANAWQPETTSGIRAIASDDQLKSWCQAMEQRTKELEAKPTPAAKKTESPAAPITPSAPTPTVDVEAWRVKKAVSGNQRFQRPVEASAATGSETFGQPAAVITVIPRETTATEKPEHTEDNEPPENVPQSEKENEVSTEKTGENPNDKGSSEPKPIPQRLLVAVLLKQDKLQQVAANHPLVKHMLLTKEDIQFFGTVFQTPEDVEERVRLLDEALAEFQEKPAAEKEAPAAKDGLVTPVTMQRYKELIAQLRAIDAGHEALRLNALDPEVTPETIGLERCTRLEQFITAAKKKTADGEKKVPDQPKTVAERNQQFLNWILGGAVAVAALVVVWIIIATLINQSPVTPVTKTSVKPLNQRMQDIRKQFAEEEN